MALKLQGELVLFLMNPINDKSKIIKGVFQGKLKFYKLSFPDVIE